jgi:hypothetical protein
VNRDYKWNSCLELLLRILLYCFLRCATNTSAARSITANRGLSRAGAGSAIASGPGFARVPAALGFVWIAICHSDLAQHSGQPQPEHPPLAPSLPGLSVASSFPNSPGFPRLSGSFGSFSPRSARPRGRDARRADTERESFYCACAEGRPRRGARRVCRPHDHRGFSAFVRLSGPFGISVSRCAPAGCDPRDAVWARTCSATKP